MINFRGIVVAVAASMIVAGCGGGGASGVTPPAGNPGGTGGSQSSTPSSIARNLLGEGLSATSAIGQFGSTIVDGVAAYGSSGPTVKSANTCNNGVISSYKYTPGAGGTGTGALIVQSFYDPACKTLWKTTQYTIAYPGMNGTETSTGTEKSQDMSGNVYDYQTVQTSMTLVNGKKQEFSEYKVESTAQGQTPFASFGWSCDYANYGLAGPGTGGSIACNRANYADASPPYQNQGAGIGYAASVAGNVSPVTYPTVNCFQWSVQWNYSGDGYTGNSLGLLGDLTNPAGSGDNWSVTGGTLASQINTVANLTFDCANMVRAENTTLTDPTNNATATLTYNGPVSGGPGLKGSVMQGGNQIATMTLNLAGNGQINYSDSTIDYVINWTITSQQKTVGGSRTT